MGKTHIFVILAVVLLTLASSTDYCRVKSPTVNLYTTPKQTHSSSLRDYIQGSNIQYFTDDYQRVTLFSPYNQTDSIPLNFEDGYKLIGVDRFIAMLENKAYPGVLVAMKEDKVVVAEMEQTGPIKLTVTKYRPPYQLPTNMSCYGANIVDKNYTVVINCQNLEKTINYLCLLRAKTTQPTCTQGDAKFQVQTKVTQVNYLKTNVEQFTWILTVDVPTNSSVQNTIDVYSVTADEFVLVKKINKDDLKLDNICIVGMTTKEGNTVVVASQNGEVSYDLVSFAIYAGLPKQITSLAHQTPGRVQTISFEGANTLLIATQTTIIEAKYPQIVSIGDYEVGIDKYIVQVTASSTHIMVVTDRNKQYIYERGSTKLNRVFLQRDVDPFTILSLPSSGNSQLQFSSKKIVFVRIFPGRLVLKPGTQETNFHLTGKSGNKQCIVNIKVNPVQSPNIIYQKSPLGQFTMNSDQGLELQLNSYFGGRELSYSISDKSSADLKSQLIQLKKYEVTGGLNNMKLYQILGIDNKNFYVVGIQEPSIYIKKCTVADQTHINCDDYTHSDQVKRTVAAMHGLRHANGQIILVLAYDSNTYTYLDLDKLQWSWCIVGGDMHYSQVVVGQKYTFFTMKRENTIGVRFDNVSTRIFTKQIFSQRDIFQMDGFYPREIRIHPSNPQVFYVKTIKGICIMAVGNLKIELVKYTEIFSTYVPEDKWTFVVGHQTLLLITEQNIVEYDLETNQAKYAFDITFPIVLPVQYDAVTDTVFARTLTNELIFIRLNSINTDSIIYREQTADQNQMTATWGWLSVPESNTAYLVPKVDRLIVKANVTDKEFKKAYPFELIVKGVEKKTMEVKTNLTYINYQTTIKEKTDEKSKTPINLPSQANKETSEIYIPMARYFDGWINSYEMTCSYAVDKKLTLLTPIRFVADNKYDFKAPAKDILSGEDFIAILDSTQTIFLVDTNNKLLASVQINQPLLNCRKMTTLKKQIDSQSNSLFVFCTATEVKRQKVLRYDIKKDSLSLGSTYYLDEATYVANPHQITVIPVAQAQYWIFVHDVDVTIDSNQKEGSVKILQIKDDQFDFSDTITSADFGLKTAVPINGMDILDAKHWFVAIGGVGIGYIQLNEALQMGLQNLSASIFKFIQISSIPSIKDKTLDNNYYQTIKVLSVDEAGNAKVFVTTTNSLHMVISLTLGSEIKFVDVSETYNRMSNLPTISWASITREKVILAYYNTTAKHIRVGIYNRSEANITNSHISIPIALTEQNKFNRFVGIAGARMILPDQQKITAYSYNAPFALAGNYSSPGNFPKIKFTAKNSITQNSHEVQVKFDGTDLNGISWLWILLGIILMLIVVGISYAFYKRIKAKKQKTKKVSLMTEYNNQDEEV